MKMATVFITGSTDGLGRAAAQSILDGGHSVVLHARSKDRAKAISDLGSRSAGIVVGDLRSAADVRSIAEQVNVIKLGEALPFLSPDSRAELGRFWITDLPDGSSPYRKNICLPFFRKRWFYPGVLFRSGGAFGQSPQTLERDAVDVLVSQGVRGQRGRQSRVVLISRR